MQKNAIFSSASWEKSPVTHLTDAPGRWWNITKRISRCISIEGLWMQSSFLIVFIFFRYLPMMGRKVNLFWPITLVEKSVAYNNILQTGFKLVLTVRILQTLGFQPCYVFILDSLQAQWITVYGPRILNKMLHPNLQILPVEINTNVYVVCVQSNWVLSLYVMNISSITLSQISFYCIFCPLSLDWVQRYKNAERCNFLPQAQPLLSSCMRWRLLVH